MITPKFKTEYSKLNPKQKEAVDTIEGPVMVMAGPGTGKTTILTLRIANILLKTDTPPSGILALTFTEAGTKTMRAKLREIIGETALDVPIHTFHGFAASVITEFQDHFPHLSKSGQITEVEAEMLIREILKQKKFNKLRPLGEPDFYVSKILSTISDARKEAWTPEMIKVFAEEEIKKIKGDPLGQNSSRVTLLKATDLKRIQKCERTILFAGVYENYEDKKRKERKMDFDDLIFELLKTLREDKLLLQILQEKFLYILLDEHQDTNDSQNMIVQVIADFFETPNLFVVGDEKQAIYRFQGASVENFINFQKKWSSMKVISLIENYRSHQHILDASHKMIEQNYEKDEHKNLRLKLKSKTTEKAKLVEVLDAPNSETEEAYILQKLNYIIKKEPNKSVAIIVRKNNEVTKLLSLLEENDISASAERGVDIFSSHIGALFFYILEFLADPSKLEALAETIAGGLWGFDFEKQVKLIKLIKSENTKEIEKEIPAILAMRREMLNSSPLSYLSLITDVSGFAKLASQSPLLVEIWRSIYDLAKDLTASNHIEDSQKLVVALLNYKKTAEKKNIKIKTSQTFSQINIMTAHGSKGLEFDYVFLPYANEESWIRKNRGSYFVLPKQKEEGDEIKDERRLFYVALTRARKHICISFCNTPLRFIDELDQNYVLKNKIKEIKRPHIAQTIKKMGLKRKAQKIEYAKQVLLEKGLSVTALNHFINSPEEFFYKSILKLPEPPSASSEKGNAMHEAMANVWKNPTRLSGTLPLIRGGKKEKEIENIITYSIKNYFKKSLLPKFEKEAILEELLANAPKVASALVDHFNQTGLVKTENWVETNFEYKYKNENINLELHGKLDALIKQENKILVYDYKTREAMSENAIRGETKNSDGNYFRQLVFYKMLLESNPKFKGKKIEPALVFIKPDRKGRCPTISLSIEKSDTEKVKKEIGSLIESVWSGKFLEL